MGRILAPLPDRSGFADGAVGARMGRRKAETSNQDAVTNLNIVRLLVIWLHLHDYERDVRLRTDDRGTAESMMTNTTLHTSTWTRAGTPRSGGWRVAAIVLAIVLAVFGLALLVGGVWLIALGGSWYYALAGAGLLVTAWLLAQQRRAALPLYVVIWIATIIWAFWEVGLDVWAQVPRLVAPTVVLVLILLVLPALGRARFR